MGHKVGLDCGVDGVGVVAVGGVEDGLDKVRKLILVHRAAADTDNTRLTREVTPGDQIVEGGDNLKRGEVTGNAKDNESE